jgi:hypothetical protein
MLGNSQSIFRKTVNSDLCPMGRGISDSKVARVAWPIPAGQVSL